MFVVGRGRTASYTKVGEGMLGSRGLLRMKVLEIQPVIGLKDFAERGGVVQVDESNLYGRG